MGPRIVEEADCPVCHSNRTISNGEEWVLCEKCYGIGKRLFGDQPVSSSHVPAIRAERAKNP